MFAIIAQDIASQAAKQRPRSPGRCQSATSMCCTASNPTNQASRSKRAPTDRRRGAGCTGEWYDAASMFNASTPYVRYEASTYKGNVTLGFASHCREHASTPVRVVDRSTQFSQYDLVLEQSSSLFSDIVDPARCTPVITKVRRWQCLRSTLLSLLWLKLNRGFPLRSINSTRRWPITFRS